MASRFWVGGTGNWDASTTTNWSATSGGGGGASVPTASDDVTFDTLSNATAYTVTITATAACLSLTVGNPAAGAITFDGVSALNVSGNLSFAASISLPYAGTITMNATSGTKTMTWNGNTLLAGLTFNGSGGTFQMVDDLIMGSTKTITLTAGTFSANSRKVTMNGTGNSVSGSFTGSSSFFDLTFTGTAAKTNTRTLFNSIAVTGTFTCNGNSVTNRILLKTNFPTATFTITAATVSVSNTDFAQITGAGAGNWNISAGSTGDCGGNSGITFTTAATQTSTGTSSFTWSTHGWTTRVPLPQDDVVISNAFSGGQTITADMPRMGKSITFSCTGSPDLTNAGLNISFFGNWDATGLGSINSAIGTLNPLSVNSQTFTSGGVVHRPITIAAVGTFTLQDNLTVQGTSSLFINNGTFTATTQNLTLDFFTIQNGGSTVNMGSGTWDMKGTSGTPFTVASGTVNANTSTIKYSASTATARTFAGGGKTFYNFWFSNATGNGSLTITGNNTFNEFKCIDTNIQTIKFTAASTQTIAIFTVTGAASNLIVLNSTTTATYNLIKSGPAAVASDYLNIQHAVATPANTWYAGTHSTNNQGDSTAGSGWIFTDPPPIGKTAGARQAVNRSATY